MFFATKNYNLFSALTCLIFHCKTIHQVYCIRLGKFPNFIAVFYPEAKTFYESLGSNVLNSAECLSILDERHFYHFDKNGNFNDSIKN